MQQKAARAPRSSGCAALGGGAIWRHLAGAARSQRLQHIGVVDRAIPHQVALLAPVGGDRACAAGARNKPGQAQARAAAISWHANRLSPGQWLSCRCRPEHSKPRHRCSRAAFGTSQQCWASERGASVRLLTREEVVLDLHPHQDDQPVPAGGQRGQRALSMRAMRAEASPSHHATQGAMWWRWAVQRRARRHAQRWGACADQSGKRAHSASSMGRAVPSLPRSPEVWQRAREAIVGNVAAWHREQETQHR